MPSPFASIHRGHPVTTPSHYQRNIGHGKPLVDALIAARYWIRDQRPPVRLEAASLLSTSGRHLSTARTKAPSSTKVGQQLDRTLLARRSRYSSSGTSNTEVRNDPENGCRRRGLEGKLSLGKPFRPAPLSSLTANTEESASLISPEMGLCSRRRI
jgi:hypothetical protein